MRKAKDAATLPLFPIEDYASEIIAGIDEAGRGPLCGNVVAAAVILDPARPIEGLRDSKKLSEARREELAPVIRERALAWGVGEATPEEIDRLNILQATFLAMQRALEGLTGGIRPTLVLVDGNRLPKIDIRAEAIVKGDDLVQAISAASILAKTSRDAELRRLDALYPEYGFARHKGYGTAAHIEAIRKFGLIPGIYRKSFEPVRTMTGWSREAMERKE